MPINRPERHCTKCGWPNEDGKHTTDSIECLKQQIEILYEAVDGESELADHYSVQLHQARKRIDTLERVAEAARKVAHGGPVYVSELREVLQELDEKGAGKDA